MDIITRSEVAPGQLFRRVYTDKPATFNVWMATDGGSSVLVKAGPESDLTPGHVSKTKDSELDNNVVILAVKTESGDKVEIDALKYRQP